MQEGCSPYFQTIPWKELFSTWNGLSYKGTWNKKVLLTLRRFYPPRHLFRGSILVLIKFGTVLWEHLFQIHHTGDWFSRDKAEVTGFVCHWKPQNAFSALTFWYLKWSKPLFPRVHFYTRGPSWISFFFREVSVPYTAALRYHWVCHLSKLKHSITSQVLLSALQWLKHSRIKKMFHVRRGRKFIALL